MGRHKTFQTCHLALHCQLGSMKLMWRGHSTAPVLWQGPPRCLIDLAVSRSRTALVSVALHALPPGGLPWPQLLSQSHIPPNGFRNSNSFPPCFVTLPRIALTALLLMRSTAPRASGPTSVTATAFGYLLGPAWLSLSVSSWPFPDAVDGEPLSCLLELFDMRQIFFGNFGAIVLPSRPFGFFLARGYVVEPLMEDPVEYTATTHVSMWLPASKRCTRPLVIALSLAPRTCLPTSSE